MLTKKKNKLSKETFQKCTINNLKPLCNKKFQNLLVVKKYQKTREMQSSKENSSSHFIVVVVILVWIFLMRVAFILILTLQQLQLYLRLFLNRLP